MKRANKWLQRGGRGVDIASMGFRLLCALMGLLLALPALAEKPDATPFPTPTTKKGLQVQMIDDALALGIQHAALNVDLTRMIDPEGGQHGPTFTRGDKTYSFSPAVVAHLDRQIKPLSDKGVVVYLILLPYASGDTPRDAIMLHPNYARSEKNAGPITMFNTTTPEAADWLSATVEFLAARYSGAADNGRVWGYIAGNEVDSHWFWANMGLASADEVVSAYEAAVRLIHQAVRRHSENARVYLSLEHYWSVRYPAGNEQQCIPGRTFIEKFAALARKNVDFDWNLAHHPYPEPLTDCRFWLDAKHTPHTDDAIAVSFRNLAVLTRRLAQDDLLWNGRPRHVILSEQGFHCANTRKGERNQAAAYALAYQVVARNPGIDAFILHRHVDHAGEGGLKLGLWTNHPGTVATPDRKRPMYDLFKAAGTPEQEKAFEPALSTLGVGDWDEALRRLAGDQWN